MTRDNRSVPFGLASLPDQAGTIIVGGGLAGLELAKELDRSGATDVLVLEAGPAEDLRHVNLGHDPDAALELWVTPSSDEHFWQPWTSKSEPHFSGRSCLRRRLGGRSLYWHGVTLPIEPWALRAPWWPDSVRRDLTESWQGGPSLYERTTADIAQWRNGEKAPGDDLPPLSIGGREFLPTPQAVRGTAWGNGQRWRAYSPLDHWLDDDGRFAGRPGGVRLAAGVEVLGIQVDGQRARGVLVRDDTTTAPRLISADQVVLAAGTVENSRLALQVRRSASASTRDSLTGLVDHIEQGFLAFVEPDRLPARISALAARDSFYYTRCADETRSNLFVRFYTNRAGAVVIDAWTMGEQLPSDEGLVQCVATGTWPWQVFVRAGFTRKDLEVVDRGRAELNDLWAQLCELTGAPAHELEFPRAEDPARTLDDLMPDLETTSATNRAVSWSRTLGTGDHESSTLPLGTVLDEQQRLIGVEGVYACGPSIFPRPGAANPSLTTLALSRRLAGLLP
jgi:choline dehydrogenase-like flavoprotein